MIFDFTKGAKEKAMSQQQWLRAIYANKVAEALAQYHRRSHHARLSDLDIATQAELRVLAETVVGFIDEAK